MRIHPIRAPDLKSIQHAQEHDIQLAIRQQRAGAHAIAHTVGEHGCVGLLEPALGAEDGGVRPHRGIHVASPGVEEVNCAGGDDDAIVGDVFDRDAGEGEAEDGEIPEAFADESDNVAAFLVVLGVAEGFVGGVELGDLGPCFLLDIRSLGEESNAPLEEGCDCVESAGKHGETDGCEFGIVELGLLVEDNVGLDAWFVCPLLHALLKAFV